MRSSQDSRRLVRFGRPSEPRHLRARSGDRNHTDSQTDGGKTHREFSCDPLLELPVGLTPTVLESPRWRPSRSTGQSGRTRTRSPWVTRGKPLPVFFGGQNADANFERFKVGPGDTVVAITVVDGALLLLASLDVTDKTDAASWLLKHPDHAAFRGSRHGGQVLAGNPGAALAFSRRVPADALRAWRYDSGKDGRPLKHLEEGKVTRPDSMRGVYRLTDATAKKVLAQLAAAVPEATKAQTGDAPLLEKLRQRPDDATTAAVLADAWQQQGDPRGDLLAFELALTTCEDSQAPELWAKLEALLLDEVESRISTWAAVESVVLSSLSPRLHRELTLEEARAWIWQGPRETLNLRLALFRPGTRFVLPFRRRPSSRSTIARSSLFPLTDTSRCAARFRWEATGPWCARCCQR